MECGSGYVCNPKIADRHPQKTLCSFSLVTWPTYPISISVFPYYICHDAFINIWIGPVYESKQPVKRSIGLLASDR